MKINVLKYVMILAVVFASMYFVSDWHNLEPGNQVKQVIENQKLSIFQIALLLSTLIFVMLTLFLKKRAQFNELKAQVKDSQLKTEVLLTQSRQAAMYEMISILAHQWRQPLTTISMNVNNILVDMELGEFDNKTLSNELNNISVQTQKLSQTVEEYKNYFKPKSEKETVWVSKLIEEALSILGSSLENHHISLKTQVHHDCQITTHSQELMQVIMSLVINAKEVFEGSPVENRWISVSLDVKNNSCLLVVEDNAAGIDESIMSRIFDPYFSTKPSKNNSGLALYIAKTIISFHMGGVIRVSNTAEGTRFEIILPIKESQYV